LKRGPAAAGATLGGKIQPGNAVAREGLKALAGAATPSA
jgi:hypothetical protein